MRNPIALLAALLPRKRATEGAYRPGPYLLQDGMLSATAGRYLNWWQLGGYGLQAPNTGSAIVEACVSAYAQTVAQCPGDHWRALDNGGRERVTNSALSRIIRRPNDYQTISDFLLNLTRRLYTEGEAFAYAVRNSRFEIVELHLMRNGRAVVAEGGEIFYGLFGNDVAERRFDLSGPIPARDVLHVRLHTPMHPLRGVSPLLANQLSLALSGAAMNQQIAFYLNQARPSFMLETDEKLTRDEIADLRASWNEQTNGQNAGGTPILAWGLKAKPVITNANDNQLAELLKISQEDVALVFQMPLQVLGIGDTPFASTESLMSAWKSRGLGFALNHIEEAFGALFGLRGMTDEYLEFNTDALLRSSFKERVEALSAGTHRLYTINEARALEGLPAVDGGDEIRVQQQDVPLSYGANLQPPGAAPPPAPQTPSNGGNDAGRNVVDLCVRELRNAADEFTRRDAA
jgi:HK97 family phage portal protein